VAAARRRLVDCGCAPDRVKTFPPLQVVLLHDKRAFEIQRDERMKLLAVPLWQPGPLSGQNGNLLCDRCTADGDGGRCECKEPTRGPHGIFDNLLPQVESLGQTRGVLEQQIAMLRHVEALRLYAAEHGGKVPASLGDIAVPLPDDPFTGKPFVYEADGMTAHIRGRGIRRAHGPAQTGFDTHYVVMMRK
jgi:hypothetical protein